MSLSVGLRERSRAGKVERFQMIQAAKQAIWPDQNASLVRSDRRHEARLRNRAERDAQLDLFPGTLNYIRRKRQ